MHGHGETAHCLWCSRDDVPVTLKGGLAPHVNAAGRKCIGIGQLVSKTTRTPPKRIKFPQSRHYRKH